MNILRGKWGIGSRRVRLQVSAILFILGPLLMPEAAAQSKEKIKVKVGESLGNRDFTHAAYRFPVFQEAVIHFYAANPGNGKLNYNQLLGEMHFIGITRDTLALANLNQVKFISIGDVNYYYNPENKVFGEEVADFNQIKLLATHRYEPYGREKGVAFDQYSNTSATDNYATYVANGQILELNLNENFVYIKRTTFFLADQNHQFYPATKSSMLKLFPKHKAAIEKFIKTDQIDFKKEADLQKLLSFCSRLN